MKRILLIGILGLVALAGASAQQFAKTGVVNVARITQAYKAAQAKHLDDLKVAAQKDLDQMREVIRGLTDQRADAVAKNDSAKVQQLDADIAAKKAAFNDYGKKKQDELAAAADALKNDTTLAKLLPQDIEQAAISKGFALILNSSNAVVIWYGPDADITDDVINRIAAETQLPMSTKPN